MFLMSDTGGRPCSVLGPGASSVAAMSGSPAFFEPETRTFPVTSRPPSIAIALGICIEGNFKAALEKLVADRRSNTRLLKLTTMYVYKGFSMPYIQSSTKRAQTGSTVRE